MEDNKTKEGTKHTPLPWELRKHEPDNALKTRVMEIPEKVYGVYCAQDAYSILTYGLKEDVRFIIEACNNYYSLKSQLEYSQQSTKQLQDRIVELTEALKWCQKLVDNMPDELYVKIEKLLNTKS